MLTNEELKVLDTIMEYLSNLESDKADKLSNDLDKVYSKVVETKKEYSKKANEYNKNNKKYHNLTNKLYYYRKTNNQAKVRQIEEQIRALKNTTE